MSRVAPVPPRDHVAAELAAWAADVRTTRTAIVDLVAGGARLASLPSCVEPLGTPLASGPEVLAITRIGTLAVARPGAGKVATRRQLAALGIDELTAYGDVTSNQLDQLDAAS